MAKQNKYDDEDQGVFGTRGFQRLVIVSFVLLALGLIVAKMLSDKTLPIRTVHIEGTFKHVNKLDLQTKIGSLVKGNFFTVNIRKIQDKLGTHVWIDGVTIRRVWPDTLRIYITEKKPVARWAKGGLISASGKYFKVPVRGKYRLLPVFDGPVLHYKLMAEKYVLFKKQFAVAGLVIRKITVTSRRAWRINLHNGIQVRLGRIDMDKRVARLAKIYIRVLGKKSNDVRAIDLRYTNGFAVKWKSGSKIKTYAFGG